MGILIPNPIYSSSTLYKLKLGFYNLRILIEGSLPIIRSIKLRYKAVRSINKVPRPLLTYLPSSPLSKQFISYIPYST